VAGAYKWDGEPSACNAAPGAAVSPAGAVSDGPETSSTLRDYRARRPALTGRQVHVQVNENGFCSRDSELCVYLFNV